MPTVPRYSGQQVTTQVVREPRAQVTTNDVTGLQSVARATQQIAGMQQQAAQNEAEQAVVAFEREKNELFFNPDTGYFNTQGRDAYDQAGAINENLSKLQKKYSEGLSSSFARSAFDKVSNRHLTSANADIMRHSSKHLKAWEAANIKAQTENSIENASLYWNNEESLAVQRELGLASVRDGAKIRGLSPEATAEEIQTFDSSFSAATINAATMSSSTEGEAALEKYGKYLEGPLAANMKANIAKKQQSEQEQANSNFIINFAGAAVRSYGDSDDARAQITEEVNKIPDPETRKKALKESMWQLDQKLKADSEEKAAIFETGEDFIVQGGTVDQFIAQFPEEWGKLTASQKRQLQSGEAVATDYVMLSNLITMSDKKLARINPTDYHDRLNKSDRLRLMNAVKSARESGTDHQVGRTRATQTKAAAEGLFGAKNKRNKKEEAQMNEFYALVDTEVNMREEAKGAPLTSSEYTDLINSVTSTVVRERKFWFDQETDISDIEAEDLRVITNELHRRNLPATAENIINVYQQASQ